MTNEIKKNDLVSFGRPTRIADMERRLKEVRSTRNCYAHIAALAAALVFYTQDGATPEAHVQHAFWWVWAVLHTLAAVSFAYLARYTRRRLARLESSE